jgi:hypothetical protein
VKKLSEGIDVSEQDVLGLREAEKKRLQASDNTRY